MRQAPTQCARHFKLERECRLMYLAGKAFAPLSNNLESHGGWSVLMCIYIILMCLYYVTILYYITVLYWCVSILYWEVRKRNTMAAYYSRTRVLPSHTVYYMCYVPWMKWSEGACAQQLSLSLFFNGGTSFTEKERQHCHPAWNHKGLSPDPGVIGPKTNPGELWTGERKWTALHCHSAAYALLQMQCWSVNKTWKGERKWIALHCHSAAYALLQMQCWFVNKTWKGERKWIALHCHSAVYALLQMQCWSATKYGKMKKQRAGRFIDSGPLIHIGLHSGIAAQI